MFKFECVVCMGNKLINCGKGKKKKRLVLIDLVDKNIFLFVFIGNFWSLK